MNINKKHLGCVVSALSIGMLVAPKAISAEPGAGAALEEVIVTAQKRDEAIQDVPISVTAITPDQLAGSNINTLNDLQTMVPALRIDYAGAFSQPTVRGVGSSIAGTGFSSNIATYVDGFYIPSQLGSNMQLLNLQSVQVLKGPQGTLFGRNATGAAILVTLLDPTPTPTAMLKASYGRFNSSVLSGYGSDGLTDNLSADVSAYQQKSDGYVHNITTGSDTDGAVDRRGVRVSSVWNATNDLSFKLALEHHEWNDGSANSTSAYKGMSSAAVVGPIIAPGVTTLSTDPRDVSNDGQTLFSAKIDGAYLTVRADLGFGELTSLTMGRKEDSNQTLDLDSSSLGLFNAKFQPKNESYSQEFDLSGMAMSDKLDWVVGAYFLSVDDNYPDFLVSSPVQGINTWASLYNVGSFVRSYALFTDDTYNFTDDWALTLGLRYSYEKADGLINLHPFGAAFGLVPGETEFSDSWSNYSPRAVVAYKPNEASKIYFSVEKGFKAGQVSPSSLQPITVKPENILAYELGYKLAERSYRFDAALFYYDYKDMQVATYNNIAALVSNAASSTIYGAETQFSLAISDNWTTNIGAAYVHGNYDSYPNAAFFEQSPSGTFPPATADAGGNQMQRSPRFTGNVGLQYETPITAGKIRLNADYNYTTSFYFDPSNQYPQASYGLFNLNAAWIDPSDRWTLALYAKNAFDKTYRAQVLPGAAAIQQTYGEPATYGASVTYSYH